MRNRHDYPFVTSGNHGIPTDPDTGVRLPEQRTPIVRQEQISDLQLALETVEQLRSQPEVREQYLWELRSLFFMISHALDSAKDTEAGKVSTEPTPRIEDFPQELLVPGTTPISWSQETTGDATQPADEDVAVVRQAFTAPYTHKVSIYWGTCCSLPGYHSAVLLEIRDSSGALADSISTRNHGREATDPSLTLSSGCPRTFGGRTNRYPPMQPFILTDLASTGDAGGCNTPYGYSDYKHVCNDDTIAEFWNVKYNAAAVYGTCSDTTLNYLAPSCNN